MHASGVTAPVERVIVTANSGGQQSRAGTGRAGAAARPAVKTDALTALPAGSLQRRMRFDLALTELARPVLSPR